MEHSNDDGDANNSKRAQLHEIQQRPSTPSPSNENYPWRRLQANILTTSQQNFFQASSQEEPQLHYISTLISALMLACALACIAAMDAKIHCHSQQIYEIQQLFDDDQVLYTQYQRIQQEDLCHRMFRVVVIPVTIITLVGGVVCKWLIRRYQTQTDTNTTRFFQTLLATTILMFISWLYGIFSIMLRPKNLSKYNNQFQSLAAVDQMGHVGDNANLYYLSWISLSLSLSIMYQVCIETVRQRQLEKQSSNNNDDAYTNVEVTATSSSQLQLYRDSQHSWYHSLYRLRIRSGIWVAALLATLIVLASSLLLWRDVLAPAATSIMGDKRVVAGVCRAIATNSNSSKNTILPPELCIRTAFSIMSGIAAAVMCVVAIVIHMSTRHNAFHFVQDFDSSILKSPLRVEFILSAVLCTVLGFNAVVATGVQGPAATVGNLYYASWCSFLLCLRILLGCIEEMYNLGKEQSRDNDSESGSMPTTKSVSTDAESIMAPDLFDNARARKSRRFLFLSIVSTICSASALDACLNQGSELTWDQRFVIVAPTVVAVLSSVQFCMCLSPVSYLLVADNLIGGTLAVLMFLLWLVDLIITMHSHNSWAVNAIGDIKIANLYYFSWASIVTAGIHMSTTCIKILGFQEKDLMTVAWGALVKVCVVILSAGYHIWHNIEDSCSLEDIQASSYALDFCSRTVFALVVSLVGMAIGGIVVLTRVSITMCCPAFFPDRIRSHVEMIVACFLVLVFAVAVALITGIGGPGESVGDLFYATWIAFVVSLLIGIICYSEIGDKNDEQEQDKVDIETTERWEREREHDSDTEFVQMT